MDKSSLLEAKSRLCSSKPFLICLKGHPGCGKSTIAKKIAILLRAPIIDKDDLVSCFAYVKEKAANLNWNRLAYDVMLATASKQLEIGMNVILDCPLAHKWIYEVFRSLADQYEASLVLLECACSEEMVWKERLTKRGAEDQGNIRAKDQICSWEQLETQMKKYDNCWKWSEEENWDKNLKKPDFRFKFDSSKTGDYENLVEMLKVNKIILENR